MLAGMNPRFLLRAVVAAAVALAVLPGTADASSPGRAPVVLFPAFHLTKLQVMVRNQTTDPKCPRSGRFQDWFQNDQPSAFGQVCQDELETLRYDANPAKPMPLRFSEQPGVTVDVIDYGKTEAPRSTSRCTRSWSPPAIGVTRTSGWPATTRGSPPTRAVSWPGPSSWSSRPTTTTATRPCS